MKKSLITCVHYLLQLKLQKSEGGFRLTWILILKLSPTRFEYIVNSTRSLIDKDNSVMTSDTKKRGHHPSPGSSKNPNKKRSSDDSLPAVLIPEHERYLAEPKTTNRRKNKTPKKIPRPQLVKIHIFLRRFIFIFIFS